jgi:hypothetical protein
MGLKTHYQLDDFIQVAVIHAVGLLDFLGRRPVSSRFFPMDLYDHYREHCVQISDWLGEVRR